MRRPLFVLILLLPLLAIACGGSSTPTTPSTSSPPPPTGPADLQLTDLTVGTGADAVSGSTVIVHYTLWLYDPAGTDSKGTRLGSSRDANTPLTFRLGTSAVIPGFEQTVTGMKVGGIRRSIVPPSLAYGTTGTTGIAPNTWLVFEVELLASAT